MRAADDSHRRPALGPWNTHSTAPIGSGDGILEIISPAGFEHFFEEFVDRGGAFHIPPEGFADLCARYGLEADPTTIPGLVERCSLRMPGEPSQ